MGNYVSSCTFIFTPKLKTNKAARVIFPTGEIRQFQDTITLAREHADWPNYFLADMAVFWMSTNNAPKRISGKISPDSLPGSDVTLMVPEEQPRLVVGDVPEFSHRLMVCRSKKPVLDTIKEEPV
ncbi:hypothetical protein Tco_0989407 [Tanacetum coccineum]|uniref:Uncharacterized protein n=1 Tax=Tanacetum coccineum TaxID=301880 RepID=A0ABQ5EU41_9ASTR